MPTADGDGSLPVVSDSDELQHVKRRVERYVSALQLYRQWLDAQPTPPTASGQSRAEEVKAQTLGFEQLFSRVGAEAGIVHPSQGRHLRLRERDVIRALHAYYTLDDGAVELREAAGSEGDSLLQRLHHDLLPADMPYP